jgi:membrane protein implicated in regulation of membrane protease activity
MSKLIVARAISAHIARRAVRIATMIAVGILFFAFLITAALVYSFSPWWWFLLLPFLLLFGVFMIVRLVARIIISRIHAGRLDKSQREAIDGFVDKILQIVEARATPPWVFVAITVKDIVIHRDITTIKRLVADSAGLRRDYMELEKRF